MATSCEELTHWKRPWCWEGLGAGGEGDDRRWDGWMASPTRWTWVWVNSGSWWWTARPGMLQSMGSQRVEQDWETELNWTELRKKLQVFKTKIHPKWSYFRVLLHAILHKKHMKNCLPFVAMEIIDRCFKLNGLDHFPSTKWI